MTTHRPSDLLMNMLQIESTEHAPSNLHAIIDLVSKYVTSQGFTVERFESAGKPSMLAYKGAARPKRFKVLLNGHLDVVPASIDGQFRPFVRGDRLYGRGTQDMKGGASCIIEVFCELAHTLDYPIGLQLVTDEEVGGFDGTGYQRRRKVETDIFIAAESTDFAVNTDSKGICWVKLHARGKSAHGAYPWKGVNALHALTSVVEKLMKRYPSPKDEVWRTSINLARIETDNATFNKVPDGATAYVDIRYTATDKNFKNKKVTQAFLKKLAGTNVRIEYVHSGPPHHVPENSPLVRDLVRVVRAHSYIRPHEKSHGASDARFYSDARTQAVCFGPTGTGMHTDSEWISLKSMTLYKEVLRTYLRSVQK